MFWSWLFFNVILIAFHILPLVQSMAIGIQIFIPKEHIVGYIVILKNQSFYSSQAWLNCKIRVCFLDPCFQVPFDLFL